MLNNCSINNLYTEKCTILNKIKGSDIGQKSDIWVKSIIDGCYWVSRAKSGFSGSTITIANEITVLIKDTLGYVPYREFIKYRGEAKFWSLSLNDYIVKGVVLDNIDSQNITKVLSKYEPDVCRVQSIEFPKSRGVNRVKLKIVGV